MILKVLKNQKQSVVTKLTPTEDEEQIAFFQWADKFLTPSQRLLCFHPANGGSRHPLEAKNLKRKGVTRGVPDIIFLYPSLGWHGLAIELKRRDKAFRSPTPEQWLWINTAIENGYCAVVCKGWEEAVKQMNLYLGKGST